MRNDPVPLPHDLPNKPLVEAIFELRWALKDQGTGLPPQDPGFRITLGRYYDAVKKEYPILVDLPSSQVPEEMTAYSVRHQFRVKENQWPLTQIGPGILTVNDTDAYTWPDFQSRIESVVDVIFKAYPSEIAKFKPTRLELRYMDAFPYNPEKIDPAEFSYRDSENIDKIKQAVDIYTLQKLAENNRLRLADWNRMEPKTE